MAKRKLTDWERNALAKAIERGDTIQSLASRWDNVSEDQVRTVLSETGTSLPEAGQSVTALSDSERKAYIDTLASGINAQQAAQRYNVSGSRVVDEVRGAGLSVPLTEKHQGIYDQALAAGWGVSDVAERYNTNTDVVNTILGAAGLSLNPRPRDPNSPTPGTALTGNQGTDLNYPGGLPRITDQSGMYGAAPRAETPQNILGFIPQSPGLRMVRRAARRQNDPNWRGQTDTILTSGQGLTGEADTRVMTLLGS